MKLSSTLTSEIRQGIAIICCSLLLMLGQTAFSQNEASDMPMQRVDINHADAETIALVLDGVGMARAQAIVEYRDSNGVFQSLEDLLLMSGIGEATLRNNKDRISFE
jgi:competence protein ComEA